MSHEFSMADALYCWNLGLAHVDNSFGGGVSSLAALLPRFPIGSSVEGDEEYEVGTEDAAAREGSKFFASTTTIVGHPRPVSRREVGV